MSGREPSSAAFRALNQALHAAPESQVMRVVGLIDDLGNREEAERIMAPIRARLRPLRPERPLRIARLLAMPLESILASAVGWRSSSVTLPRSAIAPLCQVVSAADPELVKRVRGRIAGATTRDGAWIAEAGAELWAGAGCALAGAVGAPPEWAQAGLPAASFIGLAHGAGFCLAATQTATALADPTTAPEQRDQQVSILLRDAAHRGPTTWGMMLAWLLCGLPQAQAAREIAIGQPAGSAFRGAADAALEHFFDWIGLGATAQSPELSAAVGELRSRATALAAIVGGKAHRSRAISLQASLHASHTQYLDFALRERLLTPLSALDMAPTDATVMLLEGEARALRRLAGEIRRLGGPPHAETMLRNAATAIAANARLPAVDRARLVEIVQDAEAGLRVLQRASGG